MGFELRFEGESMKRNYVAPYMGVKSSPYSPKSRKTKRNFDGKQYSLIGVSKWSNRGGLERGEPAEKVAELLRKKGWNARVVKWKNQSGVYVRNKKTPPAGAKMFYIDSQGQTKRNVNWGLEFQNTAPFMSEIFEGKDKWNRSGFMTRYSQEGEELGTRRFNLSEKPIVFNYKIKDNGTKTKAYSSNPFERERPSMVIIGENRIPMNQSNDYSSAYDQLDTEQRRGIDLMVSSLLDRPESDLGTTDGGFLLADGTGFGKTRQMLAVANQWQMNNDAKDRPVLIVTENKETIEGSFANDAEALDIDLKDFDITTYSEIGSTSKKAKEFLNKKYGLVIYDEAHNMKNRTGPQAEKALAIEAKKAIFATATPLDTAPAGAYFLSRVTGIDQQEIYDSLGLYEEEGVFGESYWASSLSSQEINKRLAEYRRQLISSGLMMRRIHPFFGSIISSNVEMTDGIRNEEKQINDYWSKQPGLAAAGQRILELQRWEEAHKVPAIYDNLRQSLDDGKQVVVAVATSGDQAFKGLTKGTTLKEVKRRIKQLNKKSGKKSGLIPILKEKGGNKNWYVGRKGSATLLKERLAEDGINFSELTQYQKGIKEVDKFQSGESKVMIMTPQSGGTGINLDDRTGERPRHLIIGTKGFAGDKLEQLLGRVSRKTTKTPSLGEFVGLKNGVAELRQTAVLKDKLSALKSMTGSDIYGFEVFDEEWKPTIESRKANQSLSSETLVAAVA